MEPLASYVTLSWTCFITLYVMWQRRSDSSLSHGEKHCQKMVSFNMKLGTDNSHMPKKNFFTLLRYPILLCWQNFYNLWNCFFNLDYTTFLPMPVKHTHRVITNCHLVTSSNIWRNMHVITVFIKQLQHFPSISNTHG